MRTISYVTLLLVIFLSSNKAYSDKDHSISQNTDKFFKISYEDLIKNKQTISLSQIASNVEYIKLETNKDCIIGSAARCFFTDSVIFIANGGPLLKFSYSGKFLGEILKIGRGPGEIDPVGIISLIPDKKLIVSQKSSQRKLLYFNYDGKYIKSVSYPTNVQSIHVMKDGNYLYYQIGSASNTKYSFVLSNERNDTISSVKNYKFWPIPGQMMVEVGSKGPNFRPIYYISNRISFKSLYNDTVYSISSNKIVPSYYVNLGKYKIPDEIIPEKIISTGQGKNYQELSIKYRYSNVLEASNRIFLGIYCYQSGKVPPQYFLIDKTDQKGFVLINKDGESTGIVNDWDGGLDFWPIENITENKIFMPIDIMNLKKEFEINKSAKKSIKFPERQKDLSKIISNSDITDNPIIMIVTLKAKN